MGAQRPRARQPQGNLLLTLETREVEAYEKRLAKQPKAGTPAAPGVPKF